MGRSYTIHCIGYAPEGDHRDRVYYAMSRVEIAQARVKAKKDGLEITYWAAQTRTGEKILECRFGDTQLDKLVPQVKTVTCPVCSGAGRNGKYYCPVCNGSGITKPGNEKNWRAWQIEKMKKERENDHPKP